MKEHSSGAQVHSMYIQIGALLVGLFPSIHAGDNQKFLTLFSFLLGLL
jgi:hypothetical protein